MQVTPIVLLITAFLLELICAVVGTATNFELIPDLGKWTTLISAFLSLLAAFSSILLLITKKFASVLIGFSITILSVVSFAVYVTWALSWWLMN